MAVTADRVVVELEAKLDRYNRRIAGARQNFDRSMGRMQGAAAATEARSSAAFAGIGAAARRMAGIVAASLGTREIVRYGDAWTQAGNKIAAATQISGIQGAALSDLADRAIAARTAFEPYVDLYSRIQRAGGDLALTQQEVAQATDIVARSFIAGGATAQEMSSGILQLGQALASGELLGEELRAVRENAPLLARAIADEFETTIGGLKDLGQQGELTAERVLRGIINAQGEIEAAFATTNATIGDSFQNLRTALIRFVGDADDVVGATEGLASALNALADNLDLVATGAALLTTRALAPLVAALASRLAPAARTAATALQLLAVRGGAALVATQALRGALALLGGSIGAILVGLTTAGVLFANLDTGARNAEDGIARLSAAIAEAESKLGKLQSVERTLESDTEALKRANERLNEAVAAGGDVAEATARADVAALQRRIAANEDLRDAILESVKASQLALKAQAAVARQSFAEEFGGRGLDRPTPTAGIFSPLDVITGLLTPEERRIERQTDAIEQFRKEARAAVEAGDPTQAQAKFLDLEAQIKSATVEAEELGRAIDAAVSGDLPETDDTRTRTRTGAGTGAGGGAADLNEFEKELKALAERRAALQATIGVQEQLNPALDDYGVAMKAAAIEADLLAAAEKAGVEVNREQVAQLAASTAQLEERARAAEDFGSAVDGIQEETRAIRAETEALEGINPALDEFGRATETALAEQELLNLAIEAGITLTDEMRDAIRKLAEGYGEAAAAARETAAEQRAFAQGAENFKRLSRDVFGDFIQGAVNGKSAVDLLANALDDVAAKLLEISLNSIFDTGGGSSGLSGFLSGLGSIFGLASGAFGGGGGSAFNFAANTGGLYDDGGYTGGRRGKPAGVVHGEEFVVRAGPAQQFRPLLEAINERGKLPGFQDGGFVPKPPAGLDFPDVMRPRMQPDSRSETVVNLGGLHVHGVKDADSFRRSQPQMMRDLQRQLAGVANRGTA